MKVRAEDWVGVRPMVFVCDVVVEEEDSGRYADARRVYAVADGVDEEASDEEREDGSVKHERMASSESMRMPWSQRMPSKSQSPTISAERRLSAEVKEGRSEMLAGVWRGILLTAFAAIEATKSGAGMVRRVSSSAFGSDCAAASARAVSTTRFSVNSKNDGGWNGEVP